MAGFIKGVDAPKVSTQVVNQKVNKELFERFKICCLENRGQMNIVIEIFMQQYANGRLYLEEDEILKWKVDQDESETETFNSTFNKDIFVAFKKKCKDNGYFVKHVIMALMEKYASRRYILEYVCIDEFEHKLETNTTHLSLTNREVKTITISKENKKETLLKNFDNIKDNYEKNKKTLASVVVKMLKIDKDAAVDMWSYLVEKHISKVQSEYSWHLTGSIMYDGGNAIGKEQMDKIVLNNPVLKDALFSQACDDVCFFVSGVIRRKINANDLKTANELFSLVYNNKYKNNSWYKIMDAIISVEDLEVTEDAYELLETWCDKVTDGEERAKLSIKMM